jgi:hypothetical protein
VALLRQVSYDLETSKRSLQEIRIVDAKDSRALGIERVISWRPILARGDFNGD